jgi:hypothetical protein
MPHRSVWLPLPYPGVQDQRLRTPLDGLLRLRQLSDQHNQAAMTYLCPAMDPRQAEEAYVGRIAGPARFWFPRLVY